MSRRIFFILCAFVLTASCDDSVDPPVDATTGVDAGPGDDPFRDDCEAIVAEFCALPMPSDYYLISDSTTASGNRINLGPTSLPRSRLRTRAHIVPDPLNGRDGWSINGHILSYLEGAAYTGLARPDNIARSLEADSPTVLINSATGERVAHWAEIDASAENADSPKAFMIRPIAPLEHGTRYVVGIRDVLDASGALLPASAAFLSLRDDTPSEIASIEARRAGFEGVFTDLTAAGVDRADLQQAWDFTTSSLQDDTGWMISVRDQALAAVGTAGPPFTITNIEEYTVAENASVARRVFGMMTVPLFMTGPGVNEFLNLGADGMPTQNGTADYPFVVNIPRSATPDTPVFPIQYGHGLLGAFTQANSGWLSDFGNRNGYAPFGVDMIGMAEEDVGPLTIAMVNGALHDFAYIPQRLIQGLVNSLLAMRMMLGGFGEHPDMLVGGRSVIDTSAGFYYGDSQGGIFGATYMAISTDVTRGVLGVPGMPYNLLLSRSIDFDPYRNSLLRAFSDGVHIQMAQTIMQQLWDRSEPGSYASHIMTDLFPGTPSHQVILQPAIGDQQVTTLGAHVMARAIGAVAITPTFRPMYGIEEVLPPHTGSAIVEFDFGITEPIDNVPIREGEDPHGDVRKLMAAQAQSHHFFQNGEIIHTCDGACDPE